VGGVDIETMDKNIKYAIDDLFERADLSGISQGALDDIRKGLTEDAWKRVGRGLGGDVPLEKLAMQALDPTIMAQTSKHGYGDTDAWSKFTDAADAAPTAVGRGYANFALGMTGMYSTAAKDLFGIDVGFDPRELKKEEARALETQKAGGELASVAGQTSNVSWMNAFAFEDITKYGEDTKMKDTREELRFQAQHKGLIGKDGQMLVSGFENVDQLLDTLMSVGQQAYVAGGGYAQKGTAVQLGEDAVAALMYKLEAQQKREFLVGSGVYSETDMRNTARREFDAEKKALEVEGQTTLDTERQEEIKEQLQYMEENSEQIIEEKFEEEKAYWNKMQKDNLKEEWDQKKKQSEEIATKLVEAQRRERVEQALMSMLGDISHEELPQNLVDKAMSQGLSSIAEDVTKLGGTYMGSYGMTSWGATQLDITGADTKAKGSKGGIAGEGGEATIKQKEGDQPEEPKPADTADDFIFRPGQDPLQFSSGDTVLGMKSGGPLAQALGGGGRGVTINIYGSQGEIYRTVKRVLKETGTV
jgi:hypothetical protein